MSAQERFDFAPSDVLALANDAAANDIPSPEPEDTLETIARKIRENVTAYIDQFAHDPAGELAYTARALDYDEIAHHWYPELRA